MKKLILAIILLVLIPLRHFGQTPYRQYSDEGVVLDFHSINNVYLRAFLLYSINNDNRFVLIPEEKYGQFTLTPKDDDCHFMEEFESFYADVENDFSLLSKIDVTNQMSVWKSSVEASDYLSIMMDVNTANMRADNDHCINSMPFCTSEVIEFEAAYQGGATGEIGPEYGCLSSQPYPSWYHMRIHTPGQFIIHMEAHDNYGQGNDIDYCIWGPFSDPYDPCVDDLTCDKLVDCSYSTASVEDAYLGYPISEHNHGSSSLIDGNCVTSNNNPPHLPEVGEYYILVITNYAQVQQTISFTKAPNSGPGETDCGILPGIATNNGPYCVGETISLNVTAQNGATYSWTGPNGFTSTMQSPTIPNCSFEMGGTYTCVTTVGEQTTTGDTEVIVYALPIASFTHTEVCVGNPTQLNSTAETEPTGQTITGYFWDFGDGETAEGQEVTHTYAAPGEYQVTHTVETGRGHCSDEITQTVSVFAFPEALVTASPSSVMYGGTSTLSVNVSTPGNFTYHWEPANMVVNPNAQTTQTIAIQQSQEFTVTITNTQGGCTTTLQVMVNMAGSNLMAEASADQNEICENESTTLHAIPTGGTGNYTYSWSPANTLSSPNAQHPVATPPVGTTNYTCLVSDGLTEQQVYVSVTVHPIYEYTMPDQDDCDSYYWDPQGHEIIYTDHEALEYTQSGTYHRTYRDIHGCDSLVTMNVHIDYTPTPSDIYPTDSANTAPHWVVTATEFQINSYEFTFWDNTGLPRWDSIRWAFEDPTVNWVLEPDTTTQPVGRRCKMYVLNHIDDTIWLRATVYNNCAPQGVYSRYWFVCSFYDIDEFGPSTGSIDFNVVPNPNNGEMQLDLASLRGLVDIKVYDMRGNLIDKFQTYNGNNAGTITYTMKRRTQGIYFFVVTSKDGTRTKKVVIQP